jgi:maltose alpha-D-glucosyltransferase/alpha-amylase
MKTSNSVPSPVIREPLWQKKRAVSQAQELDTFEVEERWDTVLDEPMRGRFETCLQSYLPPRRWFGGKARQIKSVRIKEIIPVPTDAEKSLLLLITVIFSQGDPEVYQLPLAFATGAEAQRIEREYPHLAIARLRLKRPIVEGLLHDGVGNRNFATALLNVMADRRVLRVHPVRRKGFHFPHCNASGAKAHRSLNQYLERSSKATRPCSLGTSSS